MMNRVTLVGRLTKDPELRYTPNGIAVATFTLAVNRNFSNGEGEREADFINCVVWRKPAENVSNYLKKGSLAGVDGRLQSRSYEGTDGKRVYVTEVVADSVQFLETRNKEAGGQQTGGNSGFNTNSAGNFQNAGNGQERGNLGGASYANYTTQGARQRKQENDPFANVGQPIDISDDDLPF